MIGLLNILGFITVMKISHHSDEDKGGILITMMIKSLISRIIINKVFVY